ncbi:MAG TPA: CmcI family methyltransferase [Terriglobales bacterium]
MLAAWADTRRRRLRLSSTSGWSLLTAFDVAALALVWAASVEFALRLAPRVTALRAVPLNSALTWALFAGVAVAAFLWHEGRYQLQFQRPPGIIFAESLILAGICGLGALVIFNGWARTPVRPAVLSIAGIAAGGTLIALTVPRFVKRFEGHHILDRLERQEEFVQTEYIAPTPECPHPERWKMVDPQSAEIEVLDFLESLVRTVKPELIVETGTFVGHSAIRMARALKANGFGKIITIEFDPAIYTKANERFQASGLGDWIEARNASSLDSRIEGTIDVLFSDSDSPIREAEIRKFLPQIRANGLVLVHDASSSFKVVREAALRLEQEGLLSVVLLSTPRGLVVAQKREGRQ